MERKNYGKRRKINLYLSVLKIQENLNDKISSIESEKTEENNQLKIKVNNLEDKILNLEDKFNELLSENRNTEEDYCWIEEKLN